jgi:hypothetical protein
MKEIFRHLLVACISVLCKGTPVDEGLLLFEARLIGGVAYHNDAFIATCSAEEYHGLVA